MKAKIVIIILLVLFAVGTVWMLNHSYVIINFWTGAKIIGGFLVALTLSFFAGRWTAPHK